MFPHDDELSRIGRLATYYTMYNKPFTKSCTYETPKAVLMKDAKSSNCYIVVVVVVAAAVFQSSPKIL